MSVTIKDIADKAGVSFSTVSKALRNSPLVQEKTKQRILELADQMGYQPNISARQLVSKRSSVIGVVWPSVERTALSTLITNINDRLEQQLYTTMLSINRTDAAIEAFQRLQVDAILLFHDSGNASVKERPYRSRIPILHYGVAEDTTYPTIDVRRSKAIELAMEHLLGLGHVRIAYIGDPVYPDPLQTTKVIAYQQIMSARSLAPQVVEINGMESHDGYESTKRLLASSKDRPTAIVSGSFDLTRGIIRATEEAGLAIPSELSIVCYDNMKQTDIFQLPVTSVGVDIDLIAATVTETLLRMIEDPSDIPAIYLEPELVVKASTGRANLG
jgi:LacI family transcriptional regulator